jgi:hypothetical protein
MGFVLSSCWSKIKVQGIGLISVGFGRDTSLLRIWCRGDAFRGTRCMIERLLSISNTLRFALRKSLHHKKISEIWYCALSLSPCLCE